MTENLVGKRVRLHKQCGPHFPAGTIALVTANPKQDGGMVEIERAVTAKSLAWVDEIDILPEPETEGNQT